VKVDNIREQADRFLQRHDVQPTVEAQPEAISTVAVAAGEGMATVFRSVGCTKVVSGGPTMNPVEACPSDDVIVLPNDKNIIMAAKQAEGLTQKRLRVVEARSIAQGIAALLALNQDVDLETNVAGMEEARHDITTVEVCRAVRSTSVGGVNVSQGQIIAVVDDELKLAADTAEDGVLRALEGVAVLRGGDEAGGGGIAGGEGSRGVSPVRCGSGVRRSALLQLHRLR
jgi:dihydroxyacetone kinase-like predicted kinase